MSPMCVWTFVLFAAGLVYSASGLGQEVLIEDYPSVVQIENRIGVVWLQQCVGSVITNYHILSTASCLTSNLNIRRIRAGTDKRGINGVVKEIAEVYQHPTYGLLDKDGDIAVIRLESALSFGATIARAEILGEGIYLPENLPLTVVGWGATAGSDGVSYSNLHKLPLVVKNNLACLNKYLAVPTETITENMVCAGGISSLGAHFDARDIGAPLFYQTTTVAVVSFGVSSKEDDFPVVSTSVGSYTSWIVDTAS